MELPFNKINTKKELIDLPRGRYLLVTFNGKIIHEAYTRHRDEEFIGLGFYHFDGKMYKITELDKKIVIFKKGKLRLDGIPFELYALAV
jgi:hypothetical protein